MQGLALVTVALCFLASPEKDKDATARDLVSIIQRVSALAPEAQQAWIAELEQRLDRANQTLVSAEEASRRKEFYTAVLRQEKVTWDMIGAVLRETDRCERLIITKQTRQLRILTYQRFERFRPEYDRRMDALDRVTKAWDNAGKPFDQRPKLLAWLSGAIESSAKNPPVPLPPDPDFGPGQAADTLASQSPPKAQVADNLQVQPTTATQTPSSADQKRTQPAEKQTPESQKAITPAQPAALPQEKPSASPPKQPVAEKKPAAEKKPVEQEKKSAPPGKQQTPAPRPAAEPEDELPAPPKFNEPKMHGSQTSLRQPTLQGSPPPDSGPRIAAPVGTAVDSPSKTVVAAAPRLSTVPRLAAGLPHEPAAVGDGAVHGLTQAADMPATAAIGSSASEPSKPTVVAPPRTLAAEQSLQAAPPHANRKPVPTDVVFAGLRERAQATAIRVNVSDLAARVAGVNLELRALESELSEQRDWSVETLARLVDRLQTASRRRSGLATYLSLVSADDRARIESPASPQPLIADLGRQIFETRTQVAGEGSSSSPDRFAELQRLDLLSKQLAELAAGP